VEKDTLVAADERLSNSKNDFERRASHPQSRVPGVPSLLVLAACDASDRGILIISKQGKISYYNSTYACLRGIPPGQLVGHLLEELDRRGAVRALLRSDTLPRDTSAAIERRKNRETFIPVSEEGQLLGVVVVVTPAAEMPKNAVAVTGRRALGNAEGKLIWPAQYTFADIVGNSRGLTQARELALKAALCGSSVLLVGESGTGKEMFAHAIHAASPRRAFPFIPVDCSAIPRELLEAEFFGYAAGAFTGAVKEGKPGKLELAHGGTVLLDEIGEMPLELQAKLLRVLQDHRINRVGGVTPISATFTVVASTNRDLESLVEAGRFRRDLLYRLDVIRIEIPPLRERPEDISLLVEHYWEQKKREVGRVAILSREAMRALEGYAWPGNVRELRNLLERLIVTVAKPLIDPQDLPACIIQRQSGVPPSFPSFHLQTISADAERRTLERALRQAKGNRSKAARLVGLSRATLYRKLKQYRLEHINRE
jgi:transcriptional regulator with PAS, ATPase and Fis domain